MSSVEPLASPRVLSLCDTHAVGSVSVVGSNGNPKDVRDTIARADPIRNARHINVETHSDAELAPETLPGIKSPVRPAAKAVSILKSLPKPSVPKEMPPKRSAPPAPAAVETIPPPPEAEKKRKAPAAAEKSKPKAASAPKKAKPSSAVTMFCLNADMVAEVREKLPKAPEKFRTEYNTPDAYVEMLDKCDTGQAWLDALDGAVAAPEDPGCRLLMNLAVVVLEQLHRRKNLPELQFGQLQQRIATLGRTKGNHSRLQVILEIEELVAPRRQQLQQLLHADTPLSLLQFLDAVVEVETVLHRPFSELLELADVKMQTDQPANVYGKTMQEKGLTKMIYQSWMAIDVVLARAEENPDAMDEAAPEEKAEEEEFKFF